MSSKTVKNNSVHHAGLAKAASMTATGVAKWLSFKIGSKSEVLGTDFKYSVPPCP